MNPWAREEGRMDEKHLEKEMLTYQAHEAELELHSGKFVLIQGDQVVDFFGDYEDAIRAGYREFGVDKPFLVKKIEATEQAQFITRMWEPAGA